MKAQVYRYEISQEVPEPIRTVVALVVAALLMKLGAFFVGLYNPQFEWSYNIISWMFIILAILYVVYYILNGPSKAF
jgi:uncharacterized RDD family membrane protein YckC